MANAARLAQLAPLKRTGTPLHLLRSAACALLVATFTACSGSVAQQKTDADTAAEESAETPVQPAETAPETTAPAAVKSGNALAEIDAFIANQSIDKSLEGWKMHLPKPPVATFAQGETYYWHLKTNVGDIKIKLLSDVAPMHVTSTIYLTRLGFYDDTIFHRVIKGFMAQGGDPLGQGFGGPGYTYDGEFDPNVRHDRPGLLSMANAGPGTDGSQFFLTFVKTPHLDGKHTIFGEVVDGMATVMELEKNGGGNSGKTAQRLSIEKATIRTE